MPKFAVREGSLRTLLISLLPLITLFIGKAVAQLGEDNLPGFDERRAQLLAYCVATFGSAGGANYECPYVDLALLQAGVETRGLGIQHTLEKLDRRLDCADFQLPAMLKLLYDYEGSPVVSEDMMRRVRTSILGFKYWFDEPGGDDMCMWTENHHLLFSAGAYLAGQRYPDEVFTSSGKKGRELMAENRGRILRWLDFRFKAGFSEWLSNIYYNIDLLGLIALADYAKDDEVSLKATMITDVLLLDIALNCYRGTFASTHGRTNEEKKKTPEKESTNDTQWLLFGLGKLNNTGMSAIFAALSKRYKMPRCIYEIANDVGRPELINKQRMGINVREAERWGLSYSSLEDGAVWQTMEAYWHPLTAGVFLKMLDTYGWWDNSYFAPFRPYREMVASWNAAGELPGRLASYEKDLTRNLREEVNIYTYRTPYYMLSSVQNYKPGYGGDQLQVWEATLGGHAVCFTTHPAQEKGHTPNYWTGEGWLPKVAQHKNVAIVLYDIEDKPGMYFPSTLGYTHAWLPKNEFDEVLERKNWVFARYGQGYLALFSACPYTWADHDREIIAPARKNVWICELGHRKTHGEFPAFVEAISSREVHCEGLSVQYRSPSQGLLTVDFDSDLITVNGEKVALSGYPRYENPYVAEGFPAKILSVSCNGYQLTLDWNNVKRKVGTN